jgi:hypothetical protein
MRIMTFISTTSSGTIISCEIAITMHMMNDLSGGGDGGGGGGGGGSGGGGGGGGVWTQLGV